MTSKLSLVEHKRVVVNKDGKEWLSVQRLHYTEDKIELVMIRPGDKRLELVLSEEEARTLIDAIRRATSEEVNIATPYHPHYWHPDERPFYIPPVTCGSPSLQENRHTCDVVGDAYESSKTES